MSTATDNKIPDHIEVFARDLDTYTVRGFYASTDRSEINYLTGTGDTLGPLRAVIAQLDEKAAEASLFPIPVCDFYSLDDGTLSEDIWEEDGKTWDEVLMEEQTRRTEWDDVLEELARQETKWGVQNHDPITWMAILTEEVGEASQCSLHWRFGGLKSPGLRQELVQVAAVAVAFIQCLDRALWRWPVPAEVPVLGLPVPADGCVACPDCGAAGVVTKSIQRGFYVAQCSAMSKCPAFPITKPFPSEQEARDAWNKGEIGVA